MQRSDMFIFTEPQQGASYDTLLALAQRAEALGFGGFFRSDHYLVMGGGSGLPGPTDAWVTLGGLARETSTIRLGTLVSPVTFRAPGLLAISVAQHGVVTPPCKITRQIRGQRAFSSPAFWICNQIAFHCFPQSCHN